MPPSGELSTFLRAITPPGAPALHLALWGVRYGAELFPLPITNPSSHPRGDWFRTELERLMWKGIPLRHKEIEQLVKWLGSGPSRPDGLPAYRPDIWSWDRHRTEQERHGGTARRLAAAVARDLGDHSLVEVNAKVLGLGGDPGHAREYLPRGREWWSLLGVWPWTHAPLGKLPKRWRTDATFIDPLRAWHERACVELEQELARCRWGWREGHGLYRGWRDEHGVVHRGDVLKLPLEGALLAEPARVDEATKLKQMKRLGWGPEAAEAGVRAIDALFEAQAERVAAVEQARRTRRPVQ